MHVVVVLNDVAAEIERHRRGVVQLDPVPGDALVRFNFVDLDARPRRGLLDPGSAA